MPIPRKLFLLVLAGTLLAGCGGPKPTPAPANPKGLPTSPWIDTLPPDGWFSIRATGRLVPFQNDLVVVYQDGRAVYIDPSDGRQYQSQLDAAGIARWKRLFTTVVKFMSLNDDYPPGTPFPVEEDQKGLPQFNDAIRYTLMYREGDVTKKVTAYKSGAPDELATILNEFWKFLEEIKLASGE
jgi:hypothetical protein